DSNRILDQGKASTCPPPHEAHPKGRGAGSARRRARRRARETPRSSPRCCARNWGPTSNRGRKKSVPPRRRAAPRRARRLAAAATAPPQRRAPRTRARGAGAAARSRSAGAPPHRMGPAASAQGASGRGTLFPDHGLYSGLSTHTHTHTHAHAHAHTHTHTHTHTNTHTHTHTHARTRNTHTDTHGHTRGAKQMLKSRRRGNPSGLHTQTHLEQCHTKARPHTRRTLAAKKQQHTCISNDQHHWPNQRKLTMRLNTYSFRCSCKKSKSFSSIARLKLPLCVTKGAPFSTTKKTGRQRAHFVSSILTHSRDSPLPNRPATEDASSIESPLRTQMSRKSAKPRVCLRSGATNLYAKLLKSKPVTALLLSAYR
ncbi:unnamed protein product, partial [Prorocentrum cordatum]